MSDICIKITSPSSSAAVASALLTVLPLFGVATTSAKIVSIDRSEDGLTTSLVIESSNVAELRAALAALDVQKCSVTLTDGTEEVVAPETETAPAPSVKDRRRGRR